MADRYLTYLSREHARIDNEILQESKQPQPDEVQIARLKKLKLAIKDQMEAWVSQSDPTDSLSA